MKQLLTEKGIMVIASLLMLMAISFSTYTVYKSFTLKPGQEVVVSGGTTVAKPTNNIVDAKLRDDGYFVVEFEDGTTKEVGYILGKNGKNGESIAPTQAQIAVAVADYCSTNNRCDAKSPSAEQVAMAVSNYCLLRNACMGTDGTDGLDGSNGQNASTEQIMAAVAAYCSDGRCIGPQGVQGIVGATGASGQSAVMSCVIRVTNTIRTQYVAWKSVDEPDSLYKDLYMLPVWAQGQNCVDLTAQ